MTEEAEILAAVVLAVIGDINKHRFRFLGRVLCWAGEHAPRDIMEYHFCEYTCRRCGKCIEQ